MKKIIIVVAALLSMLIISGCTPVIEREDKESQDKSAGSVEVGETMSAEDRVERWESIFDREMTHKPTKAETLLITNGMRMEEVIKTIGKPHRMVPISSKYVPEWITEEGEVFGFVVSYDDETPANVDTVDLLTIYGVVANLKHVGKYDHCLDVNMEHHPTVEEINTISAGMTIEETIKILGKPHKFGGPSAFMSLIWIANDGKEYMCLLDYPDNATKDSPIEELITKSGIVHYLSEFSPYQ